MLAPSVPIPPAIHGRGRPFSQAPRSATSTSTSPGGRAGSDRRRVYRALVPVDDAFTGVEVYVFRAVLVGFRSVSRKLAVRGDKTLADLHRLLQVAFDWDDDHLYAFWPSGKFWDRESGEGFGRPGFCRDSGDRSARIRLDRLRLEVGQSLAYVFDFGDEWRVRLKLVDVRETGGAPATAILDSRGAAPPQYVWDEEGLGDVA
jgi:Plasmid pRiA4b ORF-3-like protein